MMRPTRTAQPAVPVVDEVPDFAAIADDNPFLALNEIARRANQSLSKMALDYFQNPNVALYGGLPDSVVLPARTTAHLPDTRVGLLPERTVEHGRVIALRRRRARNKVGRATRQAQRRAAA
ncbi:hypothetical protein SEA_MORGANA_117 [Gordonia phage Morgana]|uniref:Uncharacterized protein n=1 Tax=Gordonia phage Morgana TaxID=3137292 RepID=A0AAX4RAW7_9CAUD